MERFSDREDAVVIPTRRQTGRSYVSLLQHDDDEARKKAKTFSIGVAATQVYGGGGATLRSIFGSTDAAVSCNSQREYTELKERRRHLLLTMKASNETEESAGQVIQQEDLQEWLDNLQLRLHQQCNNVSASSSRPKDRRSWNCPKTKSHDETDFLLMKGGEGSSLRSRCVSGLTDNAAAALTDSHYLDDLQNALQDAHITSLHNRLAERKVNTALSQCQTTLNSNGAESNSTLHPSVRPKVQKSLKKTKSSKTVCNGIRTAAICSKDDPRYPQGSVQQLLEVKATLSGCSPTKPQQSTRKFLFFDRVQTAQDIYDAAEQLILPPARNETSPADQDLSQRDSPLIQPLEDVEVEDFWGDD